MTEKQTDRLRIKITKIKAALAADKKRWGGYYDDSRGLRYMPTGLFVKIGDWAEGAKYLKWFHKNFPNDSGFPDFLFEWTIIAFKSGDIKQAEKKVFSVFCSNTYFIDKFFGRPIVPIDKYEYYGVSTAAFADNLTYAFDQPYLSDFADWLDNFTRTERFVTASQKYIDISKRLKTEHDINTRQFLVSEEQQLEEQF